MLQVKFDMDMPDNCFVCPFCYDSGKYIFRSRECMFTGKDATYTKRQCKCPLKEVEES